MSGGGGIDVRRALRTYVVGRAAGYDSAMKERLAEAALESEAGAARPPERPASAGGSASFGVPVPEKLEFHRSASRWRDRIPGLRGGGA